MNERNVKIHLGADVYSHTLFDKIISLENLLFAWNEFKREKRQKPDVQEFALDLEDNLFELHDDLAQDRYCHSPYASFYVRDPKLRHIHKPAVRDRILHHALTLAIEPLFERYFIFGSYSSRRGKGTHAAVRRLRRLAWRMSKNNTRTVWILHCDVRKFFDSIDHDILIRLVGQLIADKKVLSLIKKIVYSYHTRSGTGIPLGNLTSQLFSNVYLNELDRFITQKFDVQNYIRYADDIIIIARNKVFLECLVTIVQDFLTNKLRLTLHPRKTVIRRWHQGVDFLGHISFPHYTILRTKTKRRMFGRARKKFDLWKRGLLGKKKFESCLQSYSGVLKHCRGHSIAKELWQFQKLAGRVFK